MNRRNTLLAAAALLIATLTGAVTTPADAHFRHYGRFGFGFGFGYPVWYGPPPVYPVVAPPRVAYIPPPPPPVAYGYGYGYGYRHHYVTRHYHRVAHRHCACYCCR